ncbi:hypothetical protein HDV04_005159 [Boothiomyces sp. JEL0838]|nr:hypothetical protein HDV04_005159 [Boothiomyces sp. JEL0838]
MKINSTIALVNSSVVLVPYIKEHVPVYHEWMKDPFLQEMTASEPLSLEEEYEMQQSWYEDEKKQSSRGKGLGVKILSLMFSYGIKHLKVNEYVAKISMSNSQSIKLFEKFGFVEISSSEIFKEITMKRAVDDAFIQTISIDYNIVDLVSQMIIDSEVTEITLHEVSATVESTELTTTSNEVQEESSQARYSWSDIARSGGAFARLGLGIAKEISHVAFETAKFSTSLGIGIGREVAGTVGVDRRIFDVAEFFAIIGISIGQTATHLSLSGSYEVVRIIQQTFGDRESIEMCKELIRLVQNELGNTDLGLFDIWKCFSALIALQNATREQWRAEVIFPSVTEIQVKDGILAITDNGDQNQLVLKNTNMEFNQTLLYRYLLFANACYGELSMNFLKSKSIFTKDESDKHYYARHTGIAFDDIVYLSHLDEYRDIFFVDQQPAFCISLDHQYQNIVLAFRGTLSTKDALIDLTCQSADFGGNVHEGMLKAVMKLSNPENERGVYQIIKKTMEKYDYDLVITGHSLGAGIAAILNLVWSDENGRVKPDIGLPHRAISVYGYACPSVLQLELGTKLGNVYSVEVGYDWLSRVSLASVLDIRNKIQQLNEIDKEEGIIMKLLAGEEHDWFALRNSFVKQPNELLPPGQIYWIANEKIYSVNDRLNVFGEILFEANITADHLPNNFETVLQSFCQ